jgi:hypothetical protein
MSGGEPVRLPDGNGLLHPDGSLTTWWVDAATGDLMILCNGIVPCEPDPSPPGGAT